nr:MAG TPA: hypothetical protein [Crassvirales sp.]
MRHQINLRYQYTDLSYIPRLIVLIPDSLVEL